MTYASDLAEFVDRARSSDLPASVMAAARLRMLDGTAVTGVGSRSALAVAVDRYLEAASRDPWLDGRPAGSKTWHGGLPDELLGFRLGAWGFAYNYADTSLFSVAHPGSIVIPALLVGARDRQVTGDQALRAVVAGYQVMEAVARPLNEGPPRMGNQVRGFRPTAMGGPFGAAAVLCLLWGLDTETTQHAFGLAANLACGLRRQNGGPVSTVRMQSGVAVRAGVSAVLLAQAGLESEDQLLEGDGGFFTAFGDGLDIETPPLPRKDEPWAVETVSVKLHCTAHNLAAAMDAIIRAAGEAEIEPARIESIEVAVPSPHAHIAGRRQIHPVSFAQARNSYEFCAAVAAVTQGYLWPDTLKSHLEDPVVRRLSDQVRLHPSDELTRSFETDSSLWPARATVTHSGGVSSTAEVLVPDGTGVTSGTQATIVEKVEQLVGGNENAFSRRLIELCLVDLDGCEDVELALADIGVFHEHNYEGLD